MYQHHTGVIMMPRLIWCFLLWGLASSFAREPWAGTAVATYWGVKAREHAESPALEGVSDDAPMPYRLPVELREEPFILVGWPTGVTRRQPGAHYFFPPGIVLATIFTLVAMLFIVKRRRKFPLEEPKVLEDEGSKDVEDQLIPESGADPEAHASERTLPFQSKLQQISSQMEWLTMNAEDNEITAIANEQSEDTREARAIVTELLERFTTLADVVSHATAVVLQQPRESEHVSQLESFVERLKANLEKIVDDTGLQNLQQLASDLRTNEAKGDAGSGVENSVVFVAGSGAENPLVLDAESAAEDSLASDAGT